MFTEFSELVFKVGWDRAILSRCVYGSLEITIFQYVKNWGLIILLIYNVFCWDFPVFSREPSEFVIHFGWNSVISLRYVTRRIDSVFLDTHVPTDQGCRSGF